MKAIRFNFFAILLLAILTSLSFLSLREINVIKAEPIQALNLVNNGGFETGTSKNFFGTKYYIPTGWTSFSDTCVHEDKTIVYEGVKSIKLDAVGDGFFLESANTLSVKGDAYYRIGYMVSATDVSETSFGITVNSYDSSGNIVETFCVDGISLQAESEWQEVSLYAGMQSTIVNVSIKIDVRNSGSEGCNIDAVFMEEISCVNIIDGASVRTTKDRPGIRFKGTVDKITYDLFKSKYKNVNVGIVILPKVYFEKISNFTFYDIDKDRLAYLDIKAEVWNNADTAQTDGYYGFNCAMVDIKKANIVRQFCARAYLRYQDGDIVKYIYSDFDIGKNCRSIQEVAISEIEMNSAYLTIEEMEILEYFANGERVSAE